MLACVVLFLATGCSGISTDDVGEMERRLLQPNLDSKNRVKLRPQNIRRSGRVLMVIPKVWGGKPEIHPDTWDFDSAIRPDGLKTVGSVIFLKPQRKAVKFKLQKAKKIIELGLVEYTAYSFDNKTNAYLGTGLISPPELPDQSSIETINGTPVIPPDKHYPLDLWIKHLTEKVD